MLQDQGAHHTSLKGFSSKRERFIPVQRDWTPTPSRPCLQHRSAHSKDATLKEATVQEHTPSLTAARSVKHTMKPTAVAASSPSVFSDKRAGSLSPMIRHAPAHLHPGDGTYPQEESVGDKVTEQSQDHTRAERAQASRTFDPDRLTLLFK